MYILILVSHSTSLPTLHRPWQYYVTMTIRLTFSDSDGIHELATALLPCYVLRLALLATSKLLVILVQLPEVDAVPFHLASICLRICFICPVSF